MMDNEEMFYCIRDALDKALAKSTLGTVDKNHLPKNKRLYMKLRKNGVSKEEAKEVSGYRSKKEIRELF